MKAPTVKWRRDHLLSIIAKGYTGGFIVTDAVDELIRAVRIKAKQRAATKLRKRSER